MPPAAQRLTLTLPLQWENGRADRTKTPGSRRQRRWGRSPQRAWRFSPLPSGKRGNGKGKKGEPEAASAAGTTHNASNSAQRQSRQPPPAPDALWTQKAQTGWGQSSHPVWGLLAPVRGKTAKASRREKALPRQDSAPSGIELHRLRELTREPPRAKTDRRRRHKPRVKAAACGTTLGLDTGFTMWQGSWLCRPWRFGPRPTGAIYGAVLIEGMASTRPFLRGIP